MKKLQNQNGFVSIIVSLIIMAILTLIVVGFASLMRREQRQAVDRQLSTAAFYAAESGVNDAIDSLNNDPDQPEITACANPPIAGYDNEIDSPNGVIKYTCVLTDSSPTSIEKDNVSDKESVVVPIDSNGETVRSLKISWQSADPALLGQFSSTMAFPQASFINGFINTGMLRVTTIPYEEPVYRNVVRNNSRTFFLFPLAGTGTPTTIGYGVFQSQGQLVSGECAAGAAPRECNVIINISASNKMYLRLKAIYNPVNVSVHAYTQQGAVGPELELSGAQRVIDVTGKANDVLRRIQVRKPIERSYTYPEFALESVDSICKRIVIWNGGADVETSGITGDTSACELD